MTTDNIIIPQPLSELVELGIRVLPAKGKIPCTPHGFKDASAVKATIRDWLLQFPDCNWALKTGVDSGVFGIDVDLENIPAFRKLEGLHDTIDTRLDLSGGGGLHYVFKHPMTRTIPNVTLPQFEVKGDTSCLAIPPSIHPNGKRYITVSKEIKPAPGWLLEMIWSAKPTEKALAKDPDKAISEHERDKTLTSIAGKLRHDGLSGEAIASALLTVNQERCSPPLPDSQVRKIARSVGRYSPGTTASSPSPRVSKPKPFHWREHAVPHDVLLGESLEPIEFLVGDILISCGTGVLAGPKKKGKSWLALQLSQAVASGTDFLGHHTKKGKVVHFALEDGKRRTQKRLQQQQTVPGLPITYFYEWLAWNTPEGFTQLRDMLQTLNPSLLVVDTLAKCLNGKPDQNSAGDMGDFGNRMHDLAVDHNVMILFIAHHGKMSNRDPGFDIRGSSAIPGATDVNIGLYKNPDATFELIGEGRDVDTHGHSPWHFSGQASLDLNPGALAILRIL